MDAMEQLLKYESELARLKTENEWLRQSAETFGELAERLNTALREISSTEAAVVRRDAA